MVLSPARFDSYTPHRRAVFHAAACSRYTTFTWNMGRKCIVFGCRSGYKDGEHVPLYRFPTDSEECQSWLKSLPNKFPPGFIPSRNQCVCVLHWPSDFHCKPCAGNKNGVPLCPPSIFTCVPPSCIPSSTSSQSSYPRSKRTKLTAKQRSQLPDQLPLFIINDQLPEVLTVEVLREHFPELIIYNSENNFILLSKDKDGPIFDHHITLIRRNSCLCLQEN